MTKLKGLKQHEVDANKAKEKQSAKNRDLRKSLDDSDWKIIRALENIILNLEDPTKAFTKKELGDVINLIKERRDTRTQVIDDWFK